jgi:hypothetical protein
MYVGDHIIVLVPTTAFLSILFCLNRVQFYDRKLQRQHCKNLQRIVWFQTETYSSKHSILY